MGGGGIRGPCGDCGLVWSSAGAGKFREGCLLLVEMYYESRKSSLNLGFVFHSSCLHDMGGVNYIRETILHV